MKTILSIITLFLFVVIDIIFFELLPKWFYVSILAWYIIIPLGVFLALFALGIFIAYSLQNKPYSMVDGKAVKSDFGFFTALLPGQVKVIIRGGSFIRPIMNTKGYTFRGLIDDSISTESPSDFWEIVDINSLSVEQKQNTTSAYPIELPYDSFWGNIFFITYRYPWWLWKRFILRITGLVFTGIWPFQTVKIYPIRYFKESTDPATGKKILTEKNNFSDHYRIKPFDFMIPIESSDTKDFVPIKLTVAFQGYISNPYDVVTNTDAGDWSNRVFNFLPSEVNDYTRQKPLDEVLVGKESGLIDTVNDLGKDKDSLFGKFGLRIIKSATPDRSMKTDNLTPEERRFQELALSKVDAEVTRTVAKGNADAVEIQAKAIQENGDVGKLVATIQRDINLADTLKDKPNVFVTIGGNDNNSEQQTNLLRMIASNKNSSKEE